MAMKHLLCAFAALFALTNTAHAETRRTEQADASALITPALFVARDADSTIYLFGTIHVRPAGAPWGGANAIAALAQAEEVWTEMEIGPDLAAQSQAMVMQYGMAPRDRPLSTWLTDEENARLNALTTRLGVQRAMFEPMRPWLAALTLSMIPVLQSGYDPHAGVDRAVVGAARGARTRAFETIEQQVRIFADLSEEAQREYLVAAIDEAGEGVDAFEELSAAWERGDLAALERLVIDEFRTEAPDFYEVVFTRRNQNWIEQLMRELDGAGVDFIAVGAGHLLGEDGLVTMLRARGVHVERVAD